MPVQGTHFFGPSGFYNGVTTKSLRFNDGGSPELSKTWASNETDSNHFTVSFWVKRCTVSSGIHTMLQCDTAGGQSTQITFQADDTMYIGLAHSGTGQRRMLTNQVFRDVSTWYHILLAYDSENATNNLKARLYVNGTEVTSFGTDERSSIGGDEVHGIMDNGATNTIGFRDHSGTSKNFLDGYLCDFNCIDGQTLTPSAFTETKQGVCIPKEYTGSYGNNGFHLNFGQDLTGGSINTVAGGNITHSDSSSFDIGASDDFTIEFFFLSQDLGTGVGSDDYGNFMGEYATAGPHFSIGYDFRSEQDIYFYTGNGAAFYWQLADNTMKENEWNHLAFQRDGTTLRAWANGTRMTTIADAASNTGYTLSDGKATDFNKAYDLSEFNIGDHNNGQRAHTGWISNVRLVVGDGNNVYADSDSNITVPTSTLTAVTGTKLLSCTNATLGDDISDENNDASNNGAVISKLSPFGTNFWQDSSGNNHDFNFRGLNYYDVVTDNPENNFPVLNPLRTNRQTEVYSEGNLRFASSQTSTNPGTTSTFAVSSGKWYWEVYIKAQGNVSNSVGIMDVAYGLEGDNVAGYNSSSGMYSYEADGNERSGNSDTSYGNTWDTGDIISVGLDMDNGNVYFYKNGTIQNSGTALQGSLNTTGSGTYSAYSLVYNNGDQIYNFGQNPTFNNEKSSQGNTDGNGRGDFQYSVPSGYLALCAANLSDSSYATIGPTAATQPDDHFDIVTWTGNGTSQNITTANFAADLVWTKTRSGGSDGVDHKIIDSVRGDTVTLESSSQDAETTDSGSVSSITSSGFTVGDYAGVNANTRGYIAWLWKGGTTSGIDTTGSDVTESGFSFNQTAGFSIVAYTGNKTDQQGVSHGLGVKPDWVVIKNRDEGSTQWVNAFPQQMSNDYMYYDSQAKSADSGNVFWFTPTTTTVEISDHDEVNKNSIKYIMYSWANIEGYQKVGTYEGNANDNGPFIYTGFRPRFVWVKNIDATESGGASWIVYDTTRSPFNVMDDRLFFNATNDNATNANYYIDFLSNGFKIRDGSSNYGYNNSNTYLYYAVAEQPFKYTNAK